MRSITAVQMANTTQDMITEGIITVNTTVLQCRRVGSRAVLKAAHES